MIVKYRCDLAVAVNKSEFRRSPPTPFPVSHSQIFNKIVLDALGRNSVILILRKDQDCEESQTFATASRMRPGLQKCDRF